MKKTLTLMLVTCLLAFVQLSCSTQPKISIEHRADGSVCIHIEPASRYLILPIQEGAPRTQIKLDTQRPADTYMDVHLAVDKVTYYVPFDLGEQTNAQLVVRNAPDSTALCWTLLEASDTFCTANREYHRPIYHHTPPYGWMNDPNGLVYKDGEYHIHYQYNPYASFWGNMHWGHSVSTDLMNWEALPIALARDTLGQIYSGSAIVDKQNCAGFGKDAIIAFYTSHADAYIERQCLAYSTDNGRTYTKYEHNPILTAADGIRDFRDPKVIWHEPTQRWIMALAADKEVRFFNSTNLIDWTYLSSFGKEYGAHWYQYECPDLIELPLDNDPQSTKWVLISNINPGGLYGGSATQYFVGQFDGTTFTPDTKPQHHHWMDYGKDHYATVCFDNTPGRAIALPWMSSWEYANSAPTLQFRSANALPRELSLFTQNGDTYLASAPVPEVYKLQRDSNVIGSIDLNGTQTIQPLLTNNDGAYLLSMTLNTGTAQHLNIELSNDNNELLRITFDTATQQLTMDRGQSGKVKLRSFKEGGRNPFTPLTSAPLSLCADSTYQLQLFMDRSSAELFIDNGRIVMTNTIFPSQPYNTLHLSTTGGTATVQDAKCISLGNE